MQELLARLAGAGIQIVPAPDLSSYLMLEREGFVALVRQGVGADGEAQLGPVGASGVLTESGFAVLQRRGERDYFVAKGFEQEAAPERVAALLRFSADVKAAVEGG